MRWIRAIFSVHLLCWIVVSAAGEKPATSHDGDDHWAFQPIVRPPVPKAANPNWVRTPVDAFVLAKLTEDSILPAESADKRTLLRRVCFDLIGLPPTLAEQRRFLADARPDAFERLVDGLLARPQYGERWARFWLDVVRYAETNGYERDGVKPHAWKYRDYVIRAFNDNTRFDRFVTEQLAGDEVPDADSWSRIATTFLRLGTWDDEPADPQVDRCDQLDDVLGTTTAAFLGMTLRCARCHDHKFEPLSQRDYYSVLAAFTPLVRPQDGRTDLPFPVAEPKIVSAWQRDKLRHEARVAENEAAEKKIRDAVRARIGKPKSKSTDAQFAAALTPAESKELERIAKSLADLRANPPKEPEMGYIWKEAGPKAPDTFVLKRGDPASPGAKVDLGVPQVLRRVRFETPSTGAVSSRRRLALARWMTQTDQPLLARVFVNRIWQQHFGDGIVASENDFGVMGDAATHPELLDWLAAEFIATGFDIKKLHRTIVLSNTYRQSATPKTGDEADAVAEAQTQLACWRQRRLTAEMIRDGMLSVSGEINLKAGGPSVFPALPRAVMEGQSRPGEGWQLSPPEEAARRSVYVFVKRSLAIPELDLLDAPDTTGSCEQRPVSTTGVQALTFLNGAFTQERAAAFARRLRREVPNDATKTVERAFEIAFCRLPTTNESDRCSRFLKEQAAAFDRESYGKLSHESTADRALISLCLVLLNSNEFVTWN